MKRNTELDPIIAGAIGPALDLLQPKMTSDQAFVQLLAIGLQESRFKYREQIGGPARGFWQFEQGGGVKGVLQHPTTQAYAVAICNARDVDHTSIAVYGRLASDDVLAAAFARLLLWTDPKALPALGDAQGAWDLYARTWRPGKPHRDTWDALYGQALAAIKGDA